EIFPNEAPKTRVWQTTRLSIRGARCAAWLVLMCRIDQGGVALRPILAGDESRRDVVRRRAQRLHALHELAWQRFTAELVELPLSAIEARLLALRGPARLLVP